MKKFYLSKNSQKYFRVHFINPDTGLVKIVKSTHVKNRDEAIMIATYWLQHGIPAARSNSKAFYKYTYQMTLGTSDSKLIIPCSPKYEICSYLLKFWDYDNSDFIQQYLAHGHSLSKKHAICMKSLVKNYWLPYFGNTKYFEDVTKKELNDFFFYLKTKKNLSAQTVNKVINCASRAARYLYDNDLIQKNPFAGIEHFKIESQKRGIPTVKEIKSLLEMDWNNTSCKLAFKLAALCGLRAGEISGLRVCDIDVLNDMIHVRHSWSEIDKLKSTKNTDTRNIPVDHETVLELLSLAKKNPNYDDFSYVFYAPHNPEEPYYPGYYGDMFYKALEKIGINKNERKERHIVFHSLRHFCATIMAQESDIKTVKSILGHRTEIMSELYSNHETEERLKSVRTIMSDAWKKYLTAS